VRLRVWRVVEVRGLQVNPLPRLYFTRRAAARKRDRLQAQAMRDVPRHVRYGLRYELARAASC
jgi:hypothetical protein